MGRGEWSPPQTILSPPVPQVLSKVTATNPDHTLCLGHLLWQLKLASGYVQLSSPTAASGGATPPPAGGSPLIASGYMSTLKLRVWRRLWEGEGSLQASLQAYFQEPRGAGLVGKGVEFCSREQLALLVTCAVWANFPTPSQFTPRCTLHPVAPACMSHGVCVCVGTLPDVYLQLQGLGVSDPTHAAVRLMPLIQQSPTMPL